MRQRPNGWTRRDEYLRIEKYFLLPFVLALLLALGCGWIN